MLAFSPSTPIWWSGIKGKLSRARNLDVWQIDAAQSQALAQLAQRSMRLQVNVQDGVAWVSDGQQSVEISPVRLNPL